MKGTKLEIKIIGDSVLRKKARPVAKITQRHKDILSQMARIMYESSGIGLAAPQVGVDEAMLVVDIGRGGLYKLVNPRIVKREGEQAIEEGCLSVPGVNVKVPRSRKIWLEALDEDGKPLALEAERLLACVFQHEIDHLLGKLIVDYVPVWKRWVLRKKIKKV
jgi:peptide deformylase